MFVVFFFMKFWLISLGAKLNHSFQIKKLKIVKSKVIEVWERFESQIQN